MPSIAETIRRLQANSLSSLSGAAAASGRLSPLSSFGSNPGALHGWSYVPPNVAGMALVVVLHGCTQTAAAYDAGAGWSALADRYGFAVLLPEQQRANNPNLCFNWFNPEDTRRDGGEAESIGQMTGAMLDRHPIDPARVFITGLSAGGAMTAVMLATYPDVFAAGGIIAGLPYGAAMSVPEALQRMRGQGHPGGTTYVDRARAAFSHEGPWPRLSVWHGDADQVVSPTNAEHIVDQWRGLHGVGSTPDRSDVVDGHVRRVWLDHDGGEVIEAYSIAGMGHGTPLATRGADGCGIAGPHMLEAGISSTRRLATSWGILGAERPAERSAPGKPAARGNPGSDRAPSAVASVRTVIDDALRTAGLLR